MQRVARGLAGHGRWSCCDRRSTEESEADRQADQAVARLQ